MVRLRHQLADEQRLWLPGCILCAVLPISSITRSCQGFLACFSLCDLQFSPVLTPVLSLCAAGEQRGSPVLHSVLCLPACLHRAMCQNAITRAGQTPSPNVPRNGGAHDPPISPAMHNPRTPRPSPCLPKHQSHPASPPSLPYYLPLWALRVMACPLRPPPLKTM